MAVVRDGQAPYATSAAVLAVIDGYRHKHPQTPFTTSNIQLLGVSQSLAPRTMQALQLLDLVDGGGEPTAAMIALREASKDDFPARLAEVVIAAYSEVFAYKDPKTDSASDLEEVFRFYRPPSMQPRMLRLFYGLCRAANLIDETPEVENKANGTASSSQDRTTQPKPAVGAAKKRPAKVDPPLAPPPPPPAGPHKRPQLIEAVVAKLPKDGEKWTAEGFEWWMNMMRLAAPQEYDFEPVSGHKGDP